MIMAAVSAIQPRSPLAAAATEAAAATRELGASATGPGPPPAPCKPGPRAGGWPVESGVAAGAPPLLLRSSGSAMGCQAPAVGLQQHLLDADLLQDGGQLIMVEVDHGVLDESQEVTRARLLYCPLKR